MSTPGTSADSRREASARYRARNRELLREKQREYRRKNAERLSESERARHLVANYGVTVNCYERMLSAQEGRCAICGSPPRNEGKRGGGLHVDHCHVSGAVRGLLCADCNHGLGRFKDEPFLLESAITYLGKVA